MSFSLVVSVFCIEVDEARMVRCLTIVFFWYFFSNFSKEDVAAALTKCKRFWMILDPPLSIEKSSHTTIYLHLKNKNTEKDIIYFVFSLFIYILHLPSFVTIFNIVCT